MSNGQLFGVIDSCLRSLSEKLDMLEQLYRTHPDTEPVLQHLESLKHRIELEERMIRLRLGIDASSLRNRPEYIPEMLGGVAVEELAERIIRELRTCQELCRTLEEYFKFFNLENVAQFYKLMRFDLYEFERKSIAITGRQTPGAHQHDQSRNMEGKDNRVANALAMHPLYFILDSSLCRNRDAVRVAYDAVAGGVRIMQTRFKNIGNRRYLDMVRKIAGICHEKDCLLIINDRPDIAMLSGADGVHVGADDFTVPEMRSLSDSMIIGRSARTVQVASQAQTDGADYIGSGAVFASRTKQTAPVIGVRGLERIAMSVDIPVVGIGGINEDNSEEVLSVGAAGFCSIGPFRARRSVRNLAADFRRTSPAVAKGQQSG